jgi:N-acetylglucosamine kinase-like BadF-type ATPase
VGRRLAGLVRQAEPGQPLKAVCVGLSGFDRGGRHAITVAKTLSDEARPQRVVVASDAAAWYLAALGTSPGVVAAVGTGTVALASDGHTAHQVDGWGHLLGDEGSGFAVGRAGLASALRSFDGRGGSARLLDRTLRRHGSVDRLTEAVYGDRSPVALVAGFATEVAACASDGDEESRRIWAAAGVAIGEDIVSAYRSVFPGGGVVPVRVGGSLTAVGDLLLQHVRDTVTAAAPELRVTVVEIDPLSGLRRLADAAEMPFAEMVVDWRTR